MFVLLLLWRGCWSDLSVTVTLINGVLVYVYRALVDVMENCDTKMYIHYSTTWSFPLMFFYTCTTSCSCLSTWYELFNHLVYKLIFTYICMWGMFDITQFSAIITKVWWEMFRSKHLLQHTILYNDFSISYCAESFGGKCRYRFSCTHIKNPYWNFSLDVWYKYRNFFSCRTYAAQSFVPDQSPY